MYTWLLWLVANACPAVAPEMGAWNSPEPGFFPGYACTIIFWPFWLSNGLMLLLPVLVFLDAARRWVRVLRRTLAVILALSFIGALCLLPQFRATHVGYWLWVASFLLAALACVPWCRGMEEVVR